jgi:hypothetical protein
MYLIPNCYRNRAVWIYKYKSVVNGNNERNLILFQIYALVHLVGAVRYKRKGYGFDPRLNLFEVFHYLNPFGGIMALGSSQMVTEMSTKGQPGGKGGQCVGMTTLPHS